MDWNTGNKDLRSKPELNTVTHINQTKWLETGLEKHRSHSSFTADELADLGSSNSGASVSAAVQWCATAESAYPEGTRFAQVMMDIEGSITVVWFQLPSNTPIAVPAEADIERCCCEPSGYHGSAFEPNHG